MTNLKQTISDNLLYLPLLWIATGMFGVDKGDKILLIVVAVCVLVSISINKLSIIKHNWKSNPWIKWLIALIIFGVISDLVHGFGSRELRALETAALFLLCIDFSKIKINRIITLLVVASLSSLFIAYFYSNIQPTDRRVWPVNAIPFASYITLLIGFSIALISYSKLKWQKAWLFVSVAVGLGALVITESRGPLLALCCTLVALGLYTLLLGKLNYKLVGLGTVLVSIVLIASLPYLQPRYDKTVSEVNQIIKGNDQTSIGLRLSVYKIGLNMIAEKPVLGYGKDVLADKWDQMHKNKEITWREKAVLGWNFHNNFIEKGVASGLLGIATMFLWLGLPLVYGWKNHRQHFVLLSTPPLLYFFACLTDTPATNGSSYVTYLMFVGLVIAYLNNDKHNKESEIKESSLV
ncbi:O-antigen ligase family protein [Vibrio breoganii]|uniref:O-antigen ligase family protein n=1 Tax=Vibrio breoganii TaxID=553239 RepID=UPI001F53D9C0|nr:O-antigen ligase family protein [Vibrio breoganii]